MKRSRLRASQERVRAQRGSDLVCSPVSLGRQSRSKRTQDGNELVGNVSSGERYRVLVCCFSGFVVVLFIS